jgi:hypothetical protein
VHDRGDTDGVGLGLLTVWPIAFYSFWGGQLLTGAADSAPTWLGSVAVLTILLTVALIVYYARHALQNEALDPGRRSAWTAGLVMLSPLAMPVYWYRYVWSP